MSFGIRIKSPIHVNTLNIPIQNFKYPKNAKNARADITLLPSGHPCGTWVPMLMLRGPKNILTPVDLIVSMTGVGKETAKRTTHHITVGPIQIISVCINYVMHFGGLGRPPLPGRSEGGTVIFWTTPPHPNLIF